MAILKSEMSKAIVYGLIGSFLASWIFYSLVKRGVITEKIGSGEVSPPTQYLPEIYKLQ